LSLSYQWRAPPFWFAYRVLFVKWSSSTRPSGVSFIVSRPIIVNANPVYLVPFLPLARPTFLVCLPGAFRQMVRKYKAIRRDFIVSPPIIVNANPVYLVPFLPLARPTFWSACRALFAKWFANTRPSGESFIVASPIGSMLKGEQVGLRVRVHPCLFPTSCKANLFDLLAGRVSTNGSQVQLHPPGLFLFSV